MEWFIIVFVTMLFVVVFLLIIWALSPFYYALFGDLIERRKQVAEHLKKLNDNSP